MDILGQYEKQIPNVPLSTPQWQPPNEHGFLIGLVIKISGGKISDERQATFVLALVAGFGLAASIAILLYSFSGPAIPPNLGLTIDQRQFSTGR